MSEKKGGEEEEKESEHARGPKQQNVKPPLGTRVPGGPVGIMCEQEPRKGVSRWGGREGRCANYRTCDHGNAGKARNGDGTRVTQLEKTPVRPRRPTAVSPEEPNGKLWGRGLKGRPKEERGGSAGCRRVPRPRV